MILSHIQPISFDVANLILSEKKRAVLDFTRITTPPAT